VQRHLADLDSVGRRCATGLHKLGARSPVPLKTNADDNGRMGWSHARAKVEYKSRMAAIAHRFTVCEHKAKVNRTMRFLAIGDVVDKLPVLDIDFRSHEFL
jgi:hypothetical protein